LAIDKGIATATTRAFRQNERKSRWARTITVTSNIKLDRMLLHSGATSRVNPGICRSVPLCATGISNAWKSKCADTTEPRCRTLTTESSRNSGNGTIHNKKQRGKTARRKARAPKQRANAAIHHATNASMFTESCTSGDSGTAFVLTAALTSTAKAKHAEVILVPRLDTGSGDFQSIKTSAALMGKIKSICVYWSSLMARAKAAIKGRNQTAREITPGTENRRNGDDFVVEFRIDAVGTV